jgi:hypothetical protein
MRWLYKLKIENGQWKMNKYLNLGNFNFIQKHITILELVLVLMILIFTGCFKQELPKWYKSQYQDNSKYMYATGEGKSKQAAINDALSFIASKISITINSTFLSQKGYYKSDNNKKSYENIKQIINAKIKDFHFYNYELINFAKVNKKYYVALKIDREKNAKLILQHAKEKLYEIKKDSLNNDYLVILKIYPKLIKKIDSVISNLYISKSLYPLPETQKTIKEAINLKNRLKQKLESIAFNIQNDYENIIHNSLSALNQKISKNGQILISSQTSTTKNKAANLYIYKINLEVTLKDKSTYNFNIKCAGKSISSYNIAKEFAVKECREKLKKSLKSILQIQP